jgi:hypothetical protein
MDLTQIGKLAQVAICLFFLLLVIAPHVMELSGRGGNTASIEKREIAKAPDFGLIFSSFPEWVRQFEGYYADSFGLRDRLILWNGLLRLRAFDDFHSSQKVTVGREGWLFYATENVLEDYMNVIPFKPEDLEKMGRILEERRVWLEGKGIKLFILIAPNKHTIYSEYLPRYIHKLGKESRLDQAKTYLERCYPKLEFVDVRETLFNAKRTQRLYYKTDTHWNGYGAFIAYGELMKRIGLHFPAVKSYSLDDFTLKVQEYKGGGLARMLSLSDRLVEETVTLVPKFDRRARDVTSPPANSVHLKGAISVREVDDPHLPKAVVFHDSFSVALMPFLSESFRRSVFAWTSDFLPELIEREKPDIVIIESVERYIHLLSTENSPEVKAALSVSR